MPLRTLPLRTLPLRTLPQQPQQPSRAPGRSFDGFKLEDLDMQYRAALREKAHRWLQEHSVKQKVLAEKLQVPQAQLSLFLSGKFRTSSQGKAVFASVFNFFEGREGHSSEDSRELSACADVLSERSAEGGDAASGSAE
uniref:Uncharacterized protein n=1 Tax=Chrysotila carterae TaxID=13221 RepID=A0A7S4BKM5_CHRCT